MRSTTVILGVALVTAATAVAGCTSSSSSPDKGGGSTAPLVLRLGAAYDGRQSDARYVRTFAELVERLSHGRMQVDVHFGVGGDAVADPEVQTANAVRTGRFDLGWIGARAWDELGVTTFQALQTPFLITNYALLDRVVRSPLAARMLAGLEDRDLVGLALVPGLLRHPVGTRRPLVSLSDYAGTRVHDIPSRATDRLLRSLGATPVHVSNAAVVRAIEQRQVDGEELSFGTTIPITAVVTPNVTFFAKALTLFANRHAFERLSEKERVVLRDAARITVTRTSSYPVRDALAFESVLVREYCRLRGPNGHVVLASSRDVADLVQATRPLVAELESDPETKALIAGVRRLAEGLPSAPPLSIPSSCLAPKPASPLSGPTVSSSALDGTYRWRLTESGARAFGPPAYDPGNRTTFPEVHGIVLGGGRWRTDGGETGTYRMSGSQISFDWPAERYTLTFAFTRDRDGTLRLTPVLPMDRGDQWVWSGAPWRRVGPPTRGSP